MATFSSYRSEQPETYYGRRIVAAMLDSADGFVLDFDDGVRIRICDAGQSCCESRYMRTDDDPAALVGGVLRRIEAKAGPEVDDANGVHEQVFVEIATDKAFITIANHNEHNGYYSGFLLSLDVEKRAP